MGSRRGVVWWLGFGDDLVDASPVRGGDSSHTPHSVMSRWTGVLNLPEVRKMDSGFRSPMKRRRDSGDAGAGGMAVSEVAEVFGVAGARLSQGNTSQPAFQFA